MRRGSFIPSRTASFPIRYLCRSRFADFASIFVRIRGHWPLRWETRPLLLQVEDCPVKHIVVLKALSVEELFEQAFEVGIVGSVLES
jgi:hypothetical protein